MVPSKLDFYYHVVFKSKTWRANEERVQVGQENRPQNSVAELKRSFTIFGLDPYA